MTLDDQFSKNYRELTEKTMSFLDKYFEHIIPAGRFDPSVLQKTKEVFDQINTLIASGKESDSATLLADYLEYATAYYARTDPFRNQDDRRLCRNVILNTVQMLANLTVWTARLYGTVPEGCDVRTRLELTADWKIHCVRSGVELVSHR